MKLLVIGAGAREHAICWKIKQSPLVSELYCAPGNPGIAQDAKIVNIEVDQIDRLLEFALQNKMNLTVVGPEVPLSLGIVDLFRSKGLKIFGPTQAAAQLESSKEFAKEIMISAGVRTARYEIFTSLDALNEHLNKQNGAVVLKADGLAAGKGVVVCQDSEQARQGAEFLFQDLGSKRVIAETFLTGQEISYIVATDGKSVVPLSSAHDYKRIHDGDRGPNTGGMGSVAPTPRLKPETGARIVDEVIRPVLREMEARGKPFSGFLYAGLMVNDLGEAYVLEFNTRLGDPECQSIMRRLDSDFVELLLGLLGEKPLVEPRWSPQTAISVVLAAAGYPGDVVKGDEIWGIDSAASFPDTVIFHAGTKIVDHKLVTSGGRVLSVSATGATSEQARAKVYRAVDMIQFRGLQCRRDIGKN